MIENLPELNPFRLSRKKIVQIAEGLSRSYAWLHPDLHANYFTISFDGVYDEIIYPRYGVLLEEGDDLGHFQGEKILGYYEIASNTIVLDAVLKDRDKEESFKRAFTAWHELGHAVLHGEWLRSHPGRIEKDKIITVESDFSSDSTNRLEQQANLFASHAAAPDWFVDFVIKSTFCLNRPIRFIRPAKYWLEAWGCRRMCDVKTFEELCMNVAYLIRHRFGDLSIQSLSYRIQQSPWLKDVSQDSTEPFQLYRTVPVHAGAIMAAV